MTTPSKPSIKTIAPPLSCYLHVATIDLPLETGKDKGTCEIIHTLVTRIVRPGTYIVSPGVFYLDKENEKEEKCYAIFGRPEPMQEIADDNRLLDVTALLESLRQEYGNSVKVNIHYEEMVKTT